MISDRIKRMGLAAFLLLVPFCILGNTSPDLCEFVITPTKFQRIFWRDFLIEFPNLYTKAEHRAYRTGTVVFLDGDTRPALNLFAYQNIGSEEDGSLSRITRLSLRTIEGSNLIDIIINDQGSNLGKSPTMRDLLKGRLPLDLHEPGLREKYISVTGAKIGNMEMRYSIKDAESKDRKILLSFVRNARKRFGIEDIQNTVSREVTWSVSSAWSKKTSTLRAYREKADGMFFGEESYFLSDRECTPAKYQEIFGNLQRGIIYYKSLLTKAIDTAFCYPNCGEDEAGGNEKR